MVVHVDVSLNPEVQNGVILMVWILMSDPRAPKSGRTWPNGVWCSPRRRERCEAWCSWSMSRPRLSRPAPTARCESRALPSPRSTARFQIGCPQLCAAGVNRAPSAGHSCAHPQLGYSVELFIIAPWERAPQRFEDALEPQQPQAKTAQQQEENAPSQRHLQLAAEEAGPHCFSPSALLCGRVRASYRAHAKQIWPLRRASNVLICAPLLLSLRFV